MTYLDNLVDGKKMKIFKNSFFLPLILLNRNMIMIFVEELIYLTKL